MKNEEIIDYLMSTGLYENTDVDMFYEKKMLDENKTVPIRDLVERFVGIDKRISWRALEYQANSNEYRHDYSGRR